MNTDLPDDEWFTLERIDDDTIAISEYGHEEQVHSYLVEGSDRAALIDTGLGVDDLASVVRDLTDRPILVVTTHAHWDHLGAHEAFDSIAVHEAEREWLAEGIPDVNLDNVRNCLVNDATRPLPEGFAPDEYEVPTADPTRIIGDGDEIDLGGRQLRVLHTPGHSPGHCCLFDPDRGHLFAGDLIYAGPLLVHFESTDPAVFAESVRRIADLDGIERILPGHHDLDIGPDFPARVREAVEELDREDELHHGSGEHEYEDFSVVL